MNTYALILNLNCEEFIKINICYEEKLSRYDQGTLVFQDRNKQKFRLYTDDFIDFIIDALYGLESGLSKAINNQLDLDPSIKPEIVSQDIGLLWNEWMRGKKYLPQEINKYGESQWVGLKYLLFTCNESHIASWMYNRKDKIFLELTPEYPWHFDKPDEKDKFVDYEEFANSYKPLVITEINRSNVYQSLTEVKHLLVLMEANDIDEWQ